MSHIPEAELHAYLDQALDRERCVEIESHLAVCTACRAERDEIAALRDRTTALLARLAPRRTAGPSFAELKRRAALRRMARQRVAHRVAWAASVVAALGIGWTASSMLTPRADRVALSPTAVQVPAGSSIQEPMPPAEAPAAPRSSVPLAPAAEATGMRAGDSAPVAVAPTHRPTPRVASTQPVRATGRPRPARPTATPAAVATELAARAMLPGSAPQPQAARAPVDSPAATAPALATSGHSGGSPTQSGRHDSTPRPLAVITQQLASGEIVRSVDGAADFSSLFTSPQRDTAAAAPADREPAAVRPPAGVSSGVAAIRRGARGFGSGGTLPSDSVRALMRRLNLILRMR